MGLLKKDKKEEKKLLKFDKKIFEMKSAHFRKIFENDRDFDINQLRENKTFSERRVLVDLRGVRAKTPEETLWLRKEQTSDEIKNEGINFLKIASYYRDRNVKKLEPPSIENLANVLSQSKKDEVCYFNDKRIFSIIFSYLIIVLKITLLAFGVCSILFPIYENIDCLKYETAGINCPQNKEDYIFYTIFKLVVVLFVSLQLYDLSQSGRALMGNQSFDERTKFTILLENINFRGHSGLFAFRATLITFLLAFSSYKSDGVRNLNVDFLEMAQFPFEELSKIDTFDSFFDYIINRNMLLFYTVILIIASIFVIIIPHPWITYLKPPSLEEKKNEEDYGILTKLATFILSLNIISYCFFIASMLNKMYEKIDENYNFNFKEAQFYILMTFLFGFITWKYTRAALTRRKSRNVPAFFLFYSPFFLASCCICGLEYADVKIFRRFLLYILVVCMGLNLVYISIAFFFTTLRKEIKFTLSIFLRRDWISVLLSCVSCALLIMAVPMILSGFTEDWFVFVYKYCFEPVGYIPVIENLPKLNETGVASSIQIIFMIIPIVTITNVGLNNFFDRKSNSFRKQRFWTCFALFLANILNYYDLQGLMDILDNLRSVGFASVDFDEESIENLEKAMLFVVFSLILEMNSCIIAPARINKTFSPVANPVYEPRGKTKNYTNEEYDIQKLEKLKQKLTNKTPDHVKHSVILKLIWIAVFFLTTTVLYAQSQNSPWITIIPNDHQSLLNFEEGEPLSSVCPVDYSSVPDAVNPLRVDLSTAASDSIQKAELLDASDKTYFLAPVLICAAFSGIFFLLHLMEPSIINPDRAMIFSGLLILPNFIYIVFIPAVVQNGVLSLVSDVEVGEGLFYAFFLYLLGIAFLILILIEGILPTASLLVDKGEVKMMEVDKSLRGKTL